VALPWKDPKIILLSATGIAQDVSVPTAAPLVEIAASLTFNPTAVFTDTPSTNPVAEGANNPGTSCVPPDHELS
jgi:hypothetical protein